MMSCNLPNNSVRYVSGPNIIAFVVNNSALKIKQSFKKELRLIEGGYFKFIKFTIIPDFVSLALVHGYDYPSKSYKKFPPACRINFWKIKTRYQVNFFPL